VSIDGDFGPATKTAVARFQRAHGLRADGLIGQSTWHLLVHVRPAKVTWTSHGAVAASAARVGTERTLPAPKSATLRDRHQEFRHPIGRG
jgi:peptidoglycan hydrolase-like protein with peptidoglycan-binding domain